MMQNLCSLQSFSWHKLVTSKQKNIPAEHFWPHLFTKTFLQLKCENDNKNRWNYLFLSSAMKGTESCACSQSTWAAKSPALLPLVSFLKKFPTRDAKLRSSSKQAPNVRPAELGPWRAPSPLSPLKWSRLFILPRAPPPPTSLCGHLRQICANYRTHLEEENSSLSSDHHPNAARTFLSAPLLCVTPFMRATRGYRKPRAPL